MGGTEVTRVRRRRQAWWLAVLPLLGALVWASEPAISAEDEFGATVRADLDVARARLEKSVANRSASDYLWVTESSSWRNGVASGWYSGFFPGALWLLFEDTGEAKWKTLAVWSSSGTPPTG